MSLASLLLTGNKNDTEHGHKPHVDDALDALFRSTHVSPDTGESIPNPSNTSLAEAVSRGHKRKRKDEVSFADHSRRPSARSTVKPPKRKKVQIMSEEPTDADGDDGEDDSALENAYLRRNAVSGSEDEDVHESEDDDEDDGVPQHETQSPSSPLKKRSKHTKKEKYVPPDEPPAQRDARTIFVGNIPIAVTKSKSLQKQLRRHIISRVPTGKIESMRFRSVAFASATGGAPPTEDKKEPTSHNNPSKQQQRQKERAAIWRETTHGSGGEEEDHASPTKESSSTFLTPAGKKRVAFIKGEFHKEADTVNAYVVFAYTPPDVAVAADVISPIEAARLAVSKCDGSTFMERTLRVDRVGKTPSKGDKDDDPRSTLFVGNLDFAAREEDLRVWFEGVVSQARGPPHPNDDDDDEGEEKWVRHVRIVRDRDTQLGKGFAYVHFADRECVDEVLALAGGGGGELKFAKRTLRVQRCKIVPQSGVHKSKAPAPAPPRAAQKPSTRVKPAPVSVSAPAGDPLLGEKLAGLSKEERKAAKAANVDRIQRRLAKKKMARTGAGDPAASMKRDRERKKGGSSKPVKVSKKGRVRSEKSLQKRNIKK